VKRFEIGLIEFIHSRYPSVTDTFRDSGKLDEDTEANLVKAIEEFKAGFSA
jgi:F-type H+/Na+-transporting ATPase subunit alpha